MKVHRLAVLVGFLLATGIGQANGDIPDPSNSYAYVEDCGTVIVSPGGGRELDTGPAGDHTVHVVARDQFDNPIVGILTTDIWMSHEVLVTCAGTLNAADAPTNQYGETAFSGRLFGGLPGSEADGYECEYYRLDVFILGTQVTGISGLCIFPASPDLNGDLEVSLADQAIFAQGYHCYSASQNCDRCLDYSGDGDVTVTDFGILGAYIGQECP